MFIFTGAFSVFMLLKRIFFNFLNRIFSVFSSSAMFSGMFDSIGQSKIFNSVVCFYSINVMNYLARLKIAGKFFFHDKAVFKNVTIGSFVWMIQRFYGNVAILYRSATFPCRTFFSAETPNQRFAYFCFRGFGTHFSFVPRFLSKMRNAAFFTKFGRHLETFVPRFSHIVFIIALVLVSNQSDSMAEDNFLKGEPAGTEAAGTIDDLIRVNNRALDRLVIRYKRGLGVNYLSASSLTILSGEVAIPNGADSIVRWRRLSASSTTSFSDLDTGAEATSTTYYVYAIGDTSSDSPTFKISASSSAPSGSTYYRKIATFYNNASGNIENVQNIRDDDGTDYRDIIKGWVKFNSSGTISSSYNVSSITDNGTGDFTVNWTVAFSSANYALSGSVEDSDSNFVCLKSGGQAASSARILIITSAGIADDPTSMNIIAIGDRT